MNGDHVGQERLVYLMQVQQIISIPEYWDAFPQKRPDVNRLGDNIYCLPEQAKNDGFSYLQIQAGSNPFGLVRVEPVYYHPQPLCMVDDIKPNRVLISKTYRYFGQNSTLRLDSSIRQLVNIPKGQHPWGYLTSGKAAEEFISYVMNKKITMPPNIVYESTKSNTSSANRLCTCR